MFNKFSTTLKMVGVGFLILVLWLSSFLVGGLVGERTGRQEEVHREIAQKWGEPQLLGGPILTIPYRRITVDKDGVARNSLDTLYLLPEKLSLDATLEPSQKKRGIFSSTVYSGKVKFAGHFDPALISSIPGRPDERDILWDRAAVSVSLTDTRGIGEALSLNWAGRAVAWESGSLVALGVPHVTGELYYDSYDKFRYAPPYPESIPGYEGGQTERIGGSGLHATVPLASQGKYNFEFTIDLKGSRLFQVAPLGNETAVSMSSSWPSPSFVGAFLPSESEVNGSGFSGHWQISSLGKNYPNAWAGSQVALERLAQFAVGVNLLESVDFYTLTNRTVKYAILFIALTFLAFFLFEVISKLRIHPMQYILVGIALVLFYLLLLSFAENIGFRYAYVLASLMTVGLIWGYSRSVLVTGKRANLIALLLIALYTYLYIVLQLEELALLFGSLLLFVVLAAVMRLTRSIDWYKSENN